MPDPKKTEEFKNQYEFSGDEEKEITRLAENMRLLSVAFIAFGGIVLAAGIILFVLGGLSDQPLTPVISTGAGMVFLFLGVWCRAASMHFDEIVQTEGGDITHLMLALDSLTNFFRWQSLLIFGLVGGLVVTIVFMLSQ